MTKQDESLLLKKPSKEEAENAVRVLLSYIGENPDREGLQDTPKRVAKAFLEQTKGYCVDPSSLLKTTFNEVGEHQDFILLRDIEFESLCEHHLVAFIGTVHIAYVPSSYVVGISKLARVVDAFAKRLQIQERMTSQIAQTVWDALQPKGLVVMAKASHHCMVVRGVAKQNSQMITLDTRGLFKKDPGLLQVVLRQMG